MVEKGSGASEVRLSRGFALGGEKLLLGEVKGNLMASLEWRSWVSDIGFWV